MFLTRLSREGLEGNKYYYEKPYNTDDPSIQLANCTCFSQGSAQEQGLSEAFPVGAMVVGTFGNAKTWYAKSPLPKGEEIREGCVVCYDGKYGHVLKVERIIERYAPNHCLCRISQSNYVEDRSHTNPNYYQSLVYDIEIGVVTKGVGLIPLGCLYPKTNDKRVSRDTSRNQVEITYDHMRARNDKMEWYKGLYIPLGIYNIEKQEEKTIDGTKYQCVKLDNNVWCALVDECYILYPKEEKQKDYKQMYDSLLSKLVKIVEEEKYD